jgi:hypothetical protein
LIEAFSTNAKITDMISNRQRGLGILVSASLVFTTGTDLKSTIGTIMDFRPNMVSIKSNPSTLIRMLRPSSTSSSNKVGETRRKMSDQIVTVSDSEGIGDGVNNSRGKVVVTNSGRTESVKLHLVLGNNTAHSNIQSSMSSESTAQTVTSEVDVIVFVLVEKLLEFGHEVVSEEISIFNVEIVGGNSVFNGVETVGDSTRLEDFLGELSSSLGSTERNDNGFGASIDEEGVRNGFSTPESFDELMNECVAREVVTGITAFHTIEVFSFAIRSSGSSEKGTSEAFVVSLNRGKDKEGN